MRRMDTRAHTPLAKWMAENGYTDESLATEIGRDRTRVLRWRKKEGLPDMEALARLEKVSGGTITAQSFAAE
jgi:transcriptional regulator with XRE-family HTH domain